MEITSDRKMEKDQFNLIAYAIAMTDYDRALTIVKELKERYVTTKDDTLASIFEKIENALIYRKKKNTIKNKSYGWKFLS
jgi:transcription elongation factor GreA-like protein